MKNKIIAVALALACSTVQANPSPEGMRKPEGIECRDIATLATKIMDLRHSGATYEESLPLMRGVPAYEWVMGQAYQYSRVYDEDLRKLNSFIFGMAMENTCLRDKW